MVFLDVWTIGNKLGSSKRMSCNLGTACQTKCFIMWDVSRIATQCRIWRRWGVKQRQESRRQVARTVRKLFIDDMSWCSSRPSTCAAIALEQRNSIAAALREQGHVALGGITHHHMLNRSLSGTDACFTRKSRAPP